MTTWDYFLMRTNTGDTGNVPGPPPATSCPDIMPWGTQDPPTDPTTFFTDNYGAAYDNPLVVGQPNRIFLRAKNLNAAQQTGRMVLYWSQAAMLLWPNGETGWGNNIISTASGQDYIPVSAAQNQIVVSSDAFLWAPQPLYGDHYCLLGGVADANHPIPPPESANIDTMDKLTQWVLNNRNCGWHNTRITQTGSPQWSEVSSLDTGAAGGTFKVSISAINCPIGWNVSYELYAPYNDQGAVCKLPWTRVDNDSFFGRYQTITVPNPYKTQVFWGAQFNGIQPTKRWQVQIEISQTDKKSQEGDPDFDPRRTGRLSSRPEAGPIPILKEVYIGGRGVQSA